MIRVSFFRHLKRKIYFPSHCFLSTGGTISIRNATLLDVPAIQSCNRRNLPEHYEAYYLNEQLRAWPSLSYVAVSEQGDMIGYALGRVNFCSVSESGSIGHVMSIAVEEPFRRDGVGGKLMIALHDQFDKMSATISTISLFCRVSNEIAIRHYKEKHGYKCAKELVSYYLDGENAWIMERKIKIYSQNAELPFSYDK